MSAQGTEQTLQPQTGGGPTSGASKEAETLQPDAGSGYSSSAAKEGQELQPDTGSGYKSASTQEEQTLQPADAGEVAGANKATEELQPASGGTSGKNTGLHLQPDENGNSSGATTTSPSDTKNPVKKVVNYMKEKADKQTDGPPTTGND